ncbi:MAG: hypothetical protein MRJ92_09725 [Nitrospira sp.]|nr:hypothetical protein [Nitrospira sp.]
MSGVVDLLQNRLVAVRSDGPQAEEAPVPAEQRDQAAEARRRASELVAEQDEALLDRYVTDGELTDEVLVRGLRMGVRRRTGSVLGGSAVHNLGIHSLLRALVHLLPSPVDRAQAVPLQGWD